MTESERETAIGKMMDAVKKKYGSEAMIDTDNPVDIQKISSGSIGLDIALGGGYPCGRIIEIYGPESSGKTTLAIHAMVEAQSSGGIVGFIDAEHAMDLSYAKDLGLNTGKKKFTMTQPDNGEQALELLDSMLQTKAYSLIVVDSVAALTPKAEIDGEMGEAKMGLHARLMSQAMRKLTSIIGSSGTVVIFINQLRDKIGVMFGNPETTTGGNALKFYASQRLDIRKVSANKDGEEFIGNSVKVKVVKNKVHPPSQIATFDILFGKGIDKLSEVVSLCVEYDIISKKGSWYNYGETKLGQGESNVKKLLADNLELVDELVEKLKQAIRETNKD